MFKYLLYILNYLASLFYTMLYNDVKVELQAVNQIEAGNSFEVNVTIYKGNISGFANFVQYLPIGCVAKPKNIPYGDFTFKDQKIIIGWMNLPPEEIISFTYEVFVDYTFEGDILLTATFNYIKDRQRESTESNVLSIKVIKKDELLSEEQLSDKEYKDLFDINKIFCYRQITRENGDLIIYYLINTQGIPRKASARIQEKIPENCQAIPLKLYNGEIIQSSNSIKIIWNILPTQEILVVSYKLVSEEKFFELPKLSGAFYYRSDDETKMFVIKEVTFLDKPIMSIVEKQELYFSSLSQMPKDYESKKEDISENITKETQHREVSLKEKTQKKNKTYKPKSFKDESLSAVYIPQPEKGVVFKVQIGAGRKKVDYVNFFKKLNIYEKITREYHEGWYKYTIGNYKEYKQARDKRNEVWQNTPIKGSFVTAYNNGIRITVQEALMITNQKWIK